MSSRDMMVYLMITVANLPQNRSFREFENLSTFDKAL